MFPFAVKTGEVKTAKIVILCRLKKLQPLDNQKVQLNYFKKEVDVNRLLDNLNVIRLNNPFKTKRALIWLRSKP